MLSHPLGESRAIADKEVRSCRCVRSHPALELWYNLMPIFLRAPKRLHSLAMALHANRRPLSMMILLLIPNLVKTPCTNSSATRTALRPRSGRKIM
jgi:hypothetical protein